MALVLRLEKRRMPDPAKSYFEQAEAGQIVLFIPAMVLAEVGYLSERNRIDCTLRDVANYIATHETIQVYPLDLSVNQTAFLINDIPELHDRLIAATAAHLDVPLITNDPKIEESKALKTVWR